jgi:antitoxin MazE
MELSVIQIGNSKGFRLPKAVLERYNIKDKVELIFEKGRLILKPITEPRHGWNQAFQEMHKVGDDQPLMNDVFKDEDFGEW